MLFTGRLDSGFVLNKPIAQEDYDEKILKEMEENGRLIITRKRDGWCIFAATDKNGAIRFYTSGMAEVTGVRLDHIKRDLGKMNIPPNSLIVGEAAHNKDGRDDIGKVISCFMGNGEKECPDIHYIIFNIVFWNEKRLNLAYYDMSKCIKSLFLAIDTPAVHPVRVIEDQPLEEARKLVKKNEWEGLVLYDCGFIIGFREDGKSPARKPGCYKWKPKKEDDFIARRFIYRPETTIVKELVLSQFNEDGEEFECGKLGSFSKEMRAQLPNENYPMVVQVEFELRFPKTGKIRNASFVRLRDDKRVEDCVSKKVYPERIIVKNKK